MDCSTAESMVNRYIDHTLSVNELESFLEHVEECSSCYDELETYFIVHKAMEQLDENGKDQILDFRELLEEDIRKSRRYILKKKFFRTVEGVVSLYSCGRAGRISVLCSHAAIVGKETDR